MIERLKEEIEWPGRTVRDRSGGDIDDTADERETTEREPSTAAGETDTQDAPALIPPERAEKTRSRLDQAWESVEAMEQEASEQLDELLDIPAEDLPQTKEAVKLLDGSHPVYGTDLPPLSDAEKLDTTDKITGEVFRRAYDTLENADTNAWGLDIEEVIFGAAIGEDAKVEPYKSVQTPLQAAGRKSPGRKEKQTLNKAIEAKEQEKKLSMWRKLAYAAGGILLKILADIILVPVEKITSAFSFTIAGVTINIGKWIALPYVWEAVLIRKAGEYLLSLALGNDPSDVEDPPPPASIGEGSESGSGGSGASGSEDSSGGDEDESSGENSNKLYNDDGSPIVKGNGLDATAPDFDNLDAEYPQQFFERLEAEGPGGQGRGQEFLMAAERVLRTTENKASAREDPKLARAVKGFDNARRLKRNLESHENIAVAWGVPSTNESENNEQLEEAQPESPDVPAAEVIGPFSKC